MSKTTVVAEPGRQDIILSRVFAAPRDRVYGAYTDPQAIPHWWGPRFLTTTVDRMEVRKGGVWRFVQRDTQGNQYAFNGVYHDAVAPERIVSTFEFEGAPGHVALETATFEELPDGSTRLTVRTVFQTVEDRDAMLRTGASEGGSESWDRLEELLAG